IGTPPKAPIAVVGGKAHGTVKSGEPVVDDYDETKAVKSQPIAMKGKMEESYLKFQSADGNIAYKIDGRIMLDGGFVKNNKDNEKDLLSNTEIRRARLAFKTKLYQDWASEFDLEFAGAKTAAEEVKGTVSGTKWTDTSSYQKLGVIEIKDMWVAYEGFLNTTIKVGNHKPPFGMDEVTTSRWLTFMESAMIAEAFLPGRRMGLSVAHWQDLFFASVGVIGDEPNFNPKDSTTGRAERFGWSGRAAVRPFIQDGGEKILHLGGNYMHRQLQSEEVDGVYKISVRPEAHFVDYKYLTTKSKLDNVDGITTWGLELAGKWDRFYAQAEYMKNTAERYGGKTDAEMDGWYAQVSYFLTNDSRPYNLSDAEFGAVKPNEKMGAVEIAIRYSTLDLNDSGAGVMGGGSESITVGLNWYVNNNLILRTNYIHVNNDDNAGVLAKYPTNDTLNILGSRVELLF
ncbi:MAG: hypothetical protein HQL93_10760, partial [Magnetococcales bacterium]|nr:hypothetical protein [Magnetococcales bacterium]